jgi:hypothetical protein
MKSDSLIGTSRWQRVFSQSKVNGAYYDGETLPTLPWDWPKNTFLQRRRQFLKRAQTDERGVSEGADSGLYESICTEYLRSGGAHPFYKRN